MMHFASALLALVSHSAPHLAARPTVMVDARFAGADSTLVDGVPTFHTIGAALRSLSVNGAERMVVFVRNGVYHEKLTIDRPRLTIAGESRDGTVISWDAIADTPSPGGGTYGTRGSFTLRIIAPDVRVEHLTVENAFDYIANMRKPASDSTKRRNAQGVALSVDGEADRTAVEDVRITGHQDTLFPNVGRSYFHHCVVTGSVDFIFGAGRAVFDECDIVSRDRGSMPNGYVTAPSTPAAQPVGLLFVHSRLLKETPTMAPASVALGRPWHPFGNPTVVPSAVYVDCWMDDHIGAKGWDRMSMVDSTGARVWWEPNTARFFEYHSTGPGALASPDRRQLSDADAERYTVARALDGWLPPRT